MTKFLSATSRRHAILTLFITLGLSACAVAPIQEMSDARQALQAARDAGAAQHAPHYLREAETHLQQAEHDLGSGRDGFDPAREQALSAKQSAITGRTVAQSISAAKNAVAEAVAAGKLSDATQTALRDAVMAAAQGDDARAIERATQAKESAERDITR